MPTCAAHSRRQAGTSLVELVIAMTVVMVLVTVMLRGTAASSTHAAVNSVLAEYLTNGRYALEVIRRDLRHAAMSPLIWEGAQVQVNGAVSAQHYGCGAGFDTTVIDAGLWAANDTNPFSSTCLATGTDRQYQRGDVMVVRKLSNQPVSAFRAKAPYLRVSYGAGNMFLGEQTPAALPSPVYDHAVLTDVYYVNAFTYSKDEKPLVPALYRLRLSAGGTPRMTPELVASNVEHLQLRLGVDDGSGNVRLVSPGAVTDWSAVRSAQVWLLLRGTQPESGLPKASYSLGDVTYSPDDSYRRTVLSTVVHLRSR